MVQDTVGQGDATALAHSFAREQATPLDALAHCLDQINQHDTTLNAFTSFGQNAQAEAVASTQRWRQGAPLSLFDGVPMIVKDNLCAAGMPTSWGNGVLAKRVCGDDEAPVARLRAAGVVVIGKGNTPEFSVDGYTDNLTFGFTRNPFDPRLTPGGSSGGAVTAVASGMAFAGLATDGGGSIRRPTGYTGLCGLKPGIGHITRAGGLPQLLLDFEVVGPIARSIRDLTALDDILTGRVPQIAMQAPQRILAIPTLETHPCDPEIRAAFDKTVAALTQAGHAVSYGALPLDLAPLNAHWANIAEIGLARFFAAAPQVAAAAAPKYREMAQRGAALSATHLYDILAHVFALREATRDLWGYDAVIMPTSAAQPWPAEQPFPTEIDGQPVGPRGHAVYTGWINAAGLPAIAFPAPVTAGLPIGVQLVGGMGSEARLLALADAVAPPFRWPEMVII